MCEVERSEAAKPFEEKTGKKTLRRKNEKNVWRKHSFFWSFDSRLAFFFPSFFSRCGALIRLARLGSALPAVLVALLLRSKPQKSGP